MTRKAIAPGEIQRRRCITLSDSFAKRAADIGGGNVSTGIRKALEAYSEPKRKR